MVLLFHSEVDDPSEWSAELKKLLPSLEVRVYPEIGEAADIDIALVWKLPSGVLKSLPNLRLMISLGAGTDHLLSQPDLPDVPIVRLVDAHMSAAMTEYVLLQVLRFHRDDPLYQEQQRNVEWGAYLPTIGPQRRVGIMGLGTLGTVAAETLRVTGFRVSGWSRRPKEVDEIECYAGDSELDAFLERTDILVCLLALVPATSGILNGRTFAKLPRGSYVINCARGEHLVEEDLLAALDSGHIAGAALDVFRVEPLPGDHPFWRHPKVFVTPHAATCTNANSAARYVADIIRRHYEGRPLLNLVDCDQGY